MFQSKRIKELEKRIEQLESKSGLYVDAPIPGSMWPVMYRKKIELSDIVQEILGRMGLELEYVEAQREGWKLKTSKKKK